MRIKVYTGFLPISDKNKGFIGLVQKYRLIKEIKVPLGGLVSLIKNCSSIWKHICYYIFSCLWGMLSIDRIGLLILLLWWCGGQCNYRFYYRCLISRFHDYTYKHPFFQPWWVHFPSKLGQGRVIPLYSTNQLSRISSKLYFKNSRKWEQD